MPVNPNPVHAPRAGHKWWILVAVGLCLFLGSIDGSIVNVALPTLMREFQTDFPTIQWVTLAYLIGLAVLVVGMGRLADMVGKKRIFSLGIVLFLAGSALCGLTPNAYWLIGFRFLQSIGAAMMLAVGVAILTETWPAHERGKAIGLSAGFISMGIVIGPAIGGVMLQYLSWHWIFYVNIPIGAVALALVLLGRSCLAAGTPWRAVRLGGCALARHRAVLLHAGDDSRSEPGFCFTLGLGLAAVGERLFVVSCGPSCA